MGTSDYLISLKAFADINGLVLLRGVGYHATEYQLAKDVNGMVQPLTQYLSPKLLATWADGYEFGRKASQSTNTPRGRKKRV